MLGGVSNHPKTLKIFSEATSEWVIFRSFGARGRPLINPIPHDRLIEGNRSGVNPRSEHVRVNFFQLIIFAHLGFSTVLIFKYSFHTILLVMHLDN